MNIIAHFVDALRTAFQAASIGAYFAPMFRPMITEQDRMQLVRITQESDEARRMRMLNSSNRQPSEL